MQNIQFLIYFSPIDIILFSIIFGLIIAGVAAYFIHSYVKRKQYEQYDEERMRVFKERLDQINANSKGNIQQLDEDGEPIVNATKKVKKAEAEVEKTTKVASSKTATAAKKTTTATAAKETTTENE